MTEWTKKLLTTDVLIIGGGTAGCYAAIRLGERGGIRVLIAEKANITRSGCLAAGVNALNAYISEGHTPEDYVDYAREDAGGIVREDLLLSIARRFNGVTEDLERRGLVILKDADGRYATRGWRNVKINGENIKPILAKGAEAEKTVTVLNHVNITDLLTEGRGKERHAAGAVGFSVRERVFYEIRAKAATWLSCDFASRFFEMHYAQITPRVYAEEWIDDIEWEYQAWCFSGKAEFVAAIQNPHGTNKKQFFSPTWERLPFVSSLPEYEGTVERPDTLPQILEYSERLAKDFIFVRVDWYGTRHGLMFSEMSFTPAYGIVKWQPSDYNMKVGELIHLPIEG